MKRLILTNNKNIEILSKLRNFICHHSDFSNALTSIDECMQMSYLNNRGGSGNLNNTYK